MSSILQRFAVTDRVAVVTGASSGLGVAFAQALAEAGADVVLAARRADRLAGTAKLVSDAGRRALSVPADVASQPDCQAVVDAAMAEFGRVDVLVNNAGVGTAGLPQAAYSASKAGLIGLTRDLAQQWTGRKGIRVNALAPGFFASEMTDQYAPGYLDQQMQRVPMGRPGDPRELAAAVVFLASDAGGYVTGQTLAVDGGMTIT